MRYPPWAQRIVAVLVLALWLGLVAIAIIVWLPGDRASLELGRAPAPSGMVTHSAAP